MSAIGEAARSLAQAFVPGASPQLLAEVVRADREAFEQRLAYERLTEAVGNATAATEAFTKAWQELALARRQERHRRLFGHPLARVFILGGRLVVVYPGGGAT